MDFYWIYLHVFTYKVIDKDQVFEFETSKQVVWIPLLSTQSHCVRDQDLI